MKIIYRSILLLAITIALAGVYTSCSEDNLANNGEPMIKYIRVSDPASADSLLIGGFQDNMIVIVGENLQDAREIWFNDQQGPLVSTFITSKTIFTVVPTEVPKEITNKMKIVFGNGKTLEHDFFVAISRPEIVSMDFEFAQPGEVTTLRGNFFYEPLTVTFSGGAVGEVIKVEENSIEFKVPSGAQPGPITVKTAFGESTSSLRYRDNRAFLNYDNLTASGSWRAGTMGSTGGLDGNYLILKGVLDKNQRTEDYSGGGYVSEFWSKANGRPEGNLFTGLPDTYVLKFEAKVVNWYGSYLNMCFTPWDHNNNNGEYWGNINARAIWGPWDSGTTPYKTKDWITVTIPLTEFKYQIASDASGNVEYQAMKFDPSKTGGLTFWMVGSPLANASPVEVYFDNVRIVPK